MPTHPPAHPAVGMPLGIHPFSAEQLDGDLPERPALPPPGVRDRIRPRRQFAVNIARARHHIPASGHGRRTIAPTAARSARVAFPRAATCHFRAGPRLPPRVDPEPDLVFRCDVVVGAFSPLHLDGEFERPASETAAAAHQAPAETVVTPRVRQAGGEFR